MNEREWERQLSALFNVAAGDPPNHVTVRAVRRRAARRRAISGAVAAVAAVAAGGIGVALASSVVTPIPAGPSPAPAGLPRFYVEHGTFSGTTGGQQDVVRATASGAITGKVRCPLPHSYVTGEAFAGRATVFMSCERIVKDVSTGGRIYRFLITRSGRAVAYTPVPGGVFNGASIYGLGAAANGSELAAHIIPARSGSPTQVVVINTATGARAIWRNSVLHEGVRFSPSTLSFADNGRELAAMGQAHCVKQTSGSRCQSPGEEMLVVSPASAGGQFASGRMIFKEASITPPASGYINEAHISPDGKTAIVAVVDGDRQNSSVSVVLVSASTGKPLRDLFKLNTGNGFSYRTVSVDPTGRFVLFDAGPSSGSINGWIDHGRLIRLKPAGDLVFTEVW